MLRLHYLEQLFVFAEEGTLSKAAEVLIMSQSSLTRNMQQLEEDLGVRLFHRSKNKLQLTETGDYVVEQARALLDQSQEFLTAVRRFDLQGTALLGGSCTPGAEWAIQARLADKESVQDIVLEMRPEEVLLEGLLDRTYSFIVTDVPIQYEGVLTDGLFKEQLYLALPPSHSLVDRESVTLRDLAGLTMLLRSELGTWQSLVDSLTETKFIVQKDWSAFEGLVDALILPSFSTNITQLLSSKEDQRVHLPITNPEATKTFYISVLKDKQHLLSSFTI